MGEIPVKESDTKILENLIEEWILKYMPFPDPDFTWTSKQESDNLVLERLDRAIVNDEWEESFYKLILVLLSHDI